MWYKITTILNYTTIQNLKKTMASQLYKHAHVSLPSLHICNLSNEWHLGVKQLQSISLHKFTQLRGSRALFENHSILTLNLHIPTACSGHHLQCLNCSVLHSPSNREHAINTEMSNKQSISMGIKVICNSDNVTQNYWHQFHGYIILNILTTKLSSN